MKAGKLHFFCPLCHHHQSTNTIQRFTVKNIGQIALLTLTATYLAWPAFGAKGIALLFPFWGAFEFFYRLRKRQALICESCGFDPFLYKQDVLKARAKLRQHWERRIENENLFAGKKLKNYRTNPVGQSATTRGDNATPGANAAGSDDKKSAAASPPSP